MILVRTDMKKSSRDQISMLTLFLVRDPIPHAPTITTLPWQLIFVWIRLLIVNHFEWCWVWHKPWEQIAINNNKHINGYCVLTIPNSFMQAEAGDDQSPGSILPMLVVEERRCYWRSDAAICDVDKLVGRELELVKTLKGKGMMWRWDWVDWDVDDIAQQPQQKQAVESWSYWGPM